MISAVKRNKLRVCRYSHWDSVVRQSYSSNHDPRRPSDCLLPCHAT